VRRSKTRAIWIYVMTLFLGVATAAVVLPGCGDDGGRDSDTIPRAQ